jgi:hypothetical protein
VMMEPTKRNSNERANEMKWKYTCSTIWNSLTRKARQNKSGKTYSSGVGLIREHQETTRRKGTNVCNHWGRNDHQRRSSTLCPFKSGKVCSITGMHMITYDQLPTVDIVLANTQENVTLVSSVASMVLQDHASKPGWSNVLKLLNLTNQNIYGEAGTYNGNFCTGDYRTRLPFQWWCIGDYDYDILETVEMANIVEFLDIDFSTLVGFEEELNT